MFCTDSEQFFETALGPQPARLLCLEDFLLKCLKMPLILAYKLCKTIGRLIAVPLSLLLLGVTFGCSKKAREVFTRCIIKFAKDLADWILFPIGLMVRFFKLLLALIIHPNIYSV